MTYPIFLFLSNLFFLPGTFLKKHKENIISTFLLISAVIVLSILSGTRSYMIGTDISVYGNATFQVASISRSLPQFWGLSTRIYAGTGEPGYLLLNFLVSRVTSNPHWFYFVLGMLTYGIVVYGIFRLQQGTSPSLLFVLFLLGFYAITFNLLRQSVALACCFPLMAEINRSKYWNAICWWLIAFSFHFSAIVIAIPVIVYLFFAHGGVTQKRLVWILFVSILTVVILLPILHLLADKGFLSSKYTYYLSQDLSENAGENSTLNRILVRLFPILLLLGIDFSLKDSIRENILFETGLMCAIFEMLWIPMLGISPAIGRVSLYFSIVKTISLPIGISKLRRWWVRVLLVIVLITFYVLTWYLQNVIQGNNQIYPFQGIWWQD